MAKECLMPQTQSSKPPTFSTPLTPQSILICPQIVSFRHTVRQAEGMGNCLECDGELAKQKALGRCSASLRIVFDYSEGVT